MPKKFVGENSKAAVAKARKDATKQSENEKKQKEVEDSLWVDDDKHVQRKMQKKQEQDKKRQEVLERKANSKAMLDEEMGSIKQEVGTPTSKITRAEIQSIQEKKPTTTAQPKKQPLLLDDEMPLVENLNRLEGDVENASSVEAAIAVLSVKEKEVDLHPERRMKAAYQAFENANLPRIKAENPSLRLTQVKQLLWKEWLKAPENPLNN